MTLHFTLRVADVVVSARFGTPVGGDMGIEGPIGKIDPFDSVGERLALEIVGGKPVAAIPFADLFADLRFRNGERQHAGGTDWRLDVVNGQDCGGAAEIASLGDTSRIKNGNGLATAAFDRLLAGFPASLRLWDGSKSGDEIVLLDKCAIVFQFGFGFCAAIGADKLVFGRIPNSLAATSRAGKFVERGDFGFGHGLNRETGRDKCDIKADRHRSWMLVSELDADGNQPSLPE